MRTVSGDYSPGSLIDSLWLAGGLVLAYAAWQPHEESMPVRLERPQRLGVDVAGRRRCAGRSSCSGSSVSVGFAAVLLAAAAR